MCVGHTAAYKDMYMKMNKGEVHSDTIRKVTLFIESHASLVAHPLRFLFHTQFLGSMLYYISKIDKLSPGYTPLGGTQGNHIPQHSIELV